MKALLTFLQDAFKIRPEEARRTALAALYLFVSIFAFITARIARTVLFLELPNYRDDLPLTYIGIAFTVGTVMYAYALFERRLRRDQTNSITLAIIILITLMMRFALDWDRSAGWFLDNPKHEIYWAFYLWVEIFGTLLIVQFWSITNEIFHSRQAKRLFAIIGGGGVLANIFAGLAIRATVKELGTENLLYVICVCLAVAIAVVQVLGRNARVELTAAKERAPSKKKLVAGTPGKQQRVFATRHVQLMAAVVMLIYLVSSLVDYQFNVIVGDSIPIKDDRSAFLGDFFTITGVVGGFIQFFITARLLERFGVLPALLLLPLSMILGTIGLIAVPFTAIAALWAASATKGSENCLRYTINDSTLQLLYLPVPAHLRGRAKAYIDGILKPVAVGGAGLVMTILVGKFEKITGIALGFQLNPYQLGWVVSIGLVGWVGALTMLRSEYLKSLVQTLQKRRLNFADSSFQISDDSTISTLSEALESDVLGQILHGLELLPFVAKKAREPLNKTVVGLLLHEAEEVRVAALQYLGHQDDALLGEDVAELLDDASKEVRAAAILAYCASMHEKAIGRTHEMLEGEEKQVQSAAVAGLIKYGGLDGVLASADVLKGMLNSDDEADRMQAAWILGEVGVDNFYQPLVPLLEDESERVRQAAVIAAGRLKTPELVKPLLENLERPRLTGVTVQALAGYGTDIEPVLAAVLADTHNPQQERSAACRVLARLGDNVAVDILVAHLLDDEVHVRAAVVQALITISKRNPGTVIPETAIDDAIRAEGKRWYRTVAAELDLEVTEDSVLLKDALDHRKGMALQQILTLLGLKYAAETIELVARNLQSSQANTRANAVEVLDNLLDKDAKPFIIPIFDDQTLERTLAAGGEVFTTERLGREERLARLLEGGDEWLKVCAALEVGSAGLKKLEPKVRQLLESKNPVARETAIAALRQLNNKKQLKKNLEPMLEDPADNVSRFAQFVINED